MSDPRPGGRAEPLAEAWLSVSDALLRGVGHALNNRVAALSAVVQVLAATGPGGPLHDALGEETARLQRAVELMRLLPRRWDSPPEPVLVPDAVREALEILPLHPDLPSLRYEWSYEGELLPVLVEPTLLTHAICLIGGAAGEAAARSGGAEVRFHGRGSETHVSVEISAGVEGVEGEVREEGAVADPASAAPLVERAGGELRVLERTPGRVRVELVLPTLAEARRRER